MSILQDLKFIESAMEMVATALINKDVKLAKACIRCIQDYLNAVHHPFGFFSASSLFKGNKN